MMIKKLFKFTINPSYRMDVLAARGFLNHWSDEKFIKRKFKLTFGYDLDLSNPQTFNEKLNWLKLNNRKPLYTKMADKYAVKEYVSQIIGKEYIVPLYAVWDKFEDIDFAKLPDSFILKTTHDSGGTVVCKNKKDFDIKKAKAKINKSLNSNFYYALREWPYKDIKPRIIAEKLLDDHSGHELTDYKFWCFNGEPKIMYCTNKASDIYENFYDMEFKPVAINHGFKRHIPEFEKPKVFEQMKTFAAKLSAGIPFVRVDFFYVDNHLYFSEFTFYDWGALRPFKSYQQDKEIGRWLILP